MLGETWWRASRLSGFYYAVGRREPGNPIGARPYSSRSTSAGRLPRHHEDRRSTGRFFDNQQIIAPLNTVFLFLCFFFKAAWGELDDKLNVESVGDVVRCIGECGRLCAAPQSHPLKGGFGGRTQGELP